MQETQGPTSTRRYQASDFYKLTNRRASTSDPTPGLQPAGQTPADQTLYPLASSPPPPPSSSTSSSSSSSADKRPIVSWPPAPCAINCPFAHCPSAALKQCSCSAVKEEGCGKLKYMNKVPLPTLVPRPVC